METCESLQTGAVSANDALLAVRKVIKNLADDVDAELSDYVLTSTANSTYASAATAASLDSVRVNAFMLGGM